MCVHNSDSDEHTPRSTQDSTNQSAGMAMSVGEQLPPIRDILGDVLQENVRLTDEALREARRRSPELSYTPLRRDFPSASSGQSSERSSQQGREHQSSRGPPFIVGSPVASESSGCDDSNRIDEVVHHDGASSWAQPRYPGEPGQHDIQRGEAAGIPRLGPVYQWGPVAVEDRQIPSRRRTDSAFGMPPGPDFDVPSPIRLISSQPPPNSGGHSTSPRTPFAADAHSSGHGADAGEPIAGPSQPRRGAVKGSIQRPRSNRTYRCKHCGKDFSRPSSLKAHLPKHTKIRAFECTFPGCNRRYTVKSNMTRHVQNAHAHEPAVAADDSPSVYMDRLPYVGRPDPEAYVSDIALGAPPGMTLGLAGGSGLGPAFGMGRGTKEPWMPAELRNPREEDEEREETQEADDDDGDQEERRQQEEGRRELQPRGTKRKRSQ